MSTREPEYLYRFRAWDSNVYYGTRHDRDLTDAQVNSGWGPWEFCTKEKYNEICQYIQFKDPCHYHAQKLLAAVENERSFLPYSWIRKKQEDYERDEKHLKGRDRKTIFLAKVAQPDGTASPWLAVTARVYDVEYAAKPANRKYIKVTCAQEHFGSWFEYMYEGTPMQAFEFHPDYAECEPK